MSPQDSSTPAGLKIIGGSLDIASASGRITIITNIVTSERESFQQEFDLSLAGSGRRASFKRIDDTSFDVIASVHDKKFGKRIEESHFVLSPNGNVLTETISDIDPVIRITSILVFYKVLFIPPAGPVFLRPVEPGYQAYIE